MKALLLVDSTRLHQLIINLLSNAIKFTEQGNISVHVATKPLTNSKIMLETIIEDTGVGIPEHKLPYIFDPFYQTDSSITRKYGGTGLGLAIVKRLVELMHGTISVVSQEGIGTKVSLLIPFDLSVRLDGELVEGLAAMDITSNDKGTNADKRYKVLVAEDSIDNQILIGAYLKKEPLDLVFVDNGNLAIEQYKEQTFDIVLMDIEMPVMDGLTASRGIREWEQKNGIREQVPIIALTAHALSEYEQKSLAAGCNMHLTKPIKRMNLIHSIYHLLGANNKQ